MKAFVRARPIMIVWKWGGSATDLKSQNVHLLSHDDLSRKTLKAKRIAHFRVRRKRATLYI